MTAGSIEDEYLIKPRIQRSSVHLKGTTLTFSIAPTIFMNRVTARSETMSFSLDDQIDIAISLHRLTDE